jgi:hypothetical protein
VSADTWPWTDYSFRAEDFVYGNLDVMLDHHASLLLRMYQLASKEYNTAARKVRRVALGPFLVWGIGICRRGRVQLE